MYTLANIIGKTLYVLLIAVVLSIALLFVGTKIDVLGYEVKIVKSGSMEPEIATGGIVVVREMPSYGVGDVVTYEAPARGDLAVTHRIVEARGSGAGASYITKGDANEDVDPNAVRARSIIGAVVFSVPYLGYIIEFARTPLGFGLLIGLPALVIILDELATIVWEVRLALARKRRAATQQHAPDGSTGEHSRDSRTPQTLDLRTHTRRHS